MEIIQKPTELKVLVNKAPVIGGQPSKNNSKKGWKQIQQEMIENTLSLEGEPTVNTYHWAKQTFCLTEQGKNDKLIVFRETLRSH